MRQKTVLPMVLCVAGIVTLLSFATHTGEAESKEQYIQGQAEATAQSFESTEFEVCDSPVPSNPAPTTVRVEDFSRVLHGVWVGQRTLREGKADPANYALFFDTDAREALAFEERGPGVLKNSFEQVLPPATAWAPQLTYFYCGGAEFDAFKDDFVKVSNDPREGLQALRQVTGTDVPDTSIFDTWSALRKLEYFTRPLEDALRNTAFYTMSLVSVEAQGSGVDRLRLDLVGQYRGSPEKFVHGQPIAGLEGGFFEGSSTLDGVYAVGQDVAILCFCDPTRVDWEEGTPLTNFKYDKVVIGPLP